MVIACSNCREKTEVGSIEVALKIQGLTYTTKVAARTCKSCLSKRIDPNELAAYKVGVAKRFVEQGRLNGRRYAYCRKALHLGSAHLAQRLNISVECLLALEDQDILVPAAMHDDMLRRVRRTFKSLAFVPRFALDEEIGSSAKAMDI